MTGLGPGCVKTRTPPGSLLFYFASYTARRLVGISVGIGSNRRRKLLYIQMVMAVVEYRPGEARRLESPYHQGWLVLPNSIRGKLM
jgi:hypothetical protein